MYSTHNERKSVAAERFIRTLKNKIYRHMRTVSKNVYIDKLDDIISEYKIILILTLLKKSVTRTLNLKLLIMLEYQNTKTFLLKDTLQIGLKKFLSLKKLRTQFHGHMLLVILMVKKLLEHFMKKNCKKQINKHLGQKK